MKVLPYKSEQLALAVRDLEGLEKMLLPELFENLKSLVLRLPKQ